MNLDILKYIRNLSKKCSIPYKLLEHFIENGASTIQELSKGAGVSLPTATNALNELMARGLAVEVGKKAESAGRTPMVYDLNPTVGYFVGVNPEMDSLVLSASDFCGNLIVEKVRIPYIYEDTPESLERMGDIVRDFIGSLKIKKEDILQVCVNIDERVNPFKGKAYNRFTFLKEPLTAKLTQTIGLPTCIENDTRSMTYAECVKGCAKGMKNVVFVNICWGLGIGIVSNGKLHYGKSGYSGEFGHMALYNNNIICHCGKVGCIETEVSGRALKRKLTESILAGKPSILSGKVIDQKQELSLQDIFDAIAKEDVLSLATLQVIADELGRQLAGIINIFNPEMLVIGGDLSVAGDYLTLPVNMGIKKYSLNVMNEDSQIVTSSLKDRAGVIGACLMARRHLLTRQ